MYIGLSNSFFAYFGLIIFITMSICQITLGIKLSKKFDKQFPKFINEKDAFENGLWIFSPYLRGLRYAGCILFKNASTKRRYCNYFFNGYNFRAEASIVDWFLIIIVLTCFIILGIVGFLLYFINGGSFYKH